MPVQSSPVPVEQRLASVHYAYIDLTVPDYLHSAIRTFISQQQWSPALKISGDCLYIISHDSSEQQLQEIHSATASLRNVVLCSSALFISPASAASSAPIPLVPTRSALASYLSLFSSYRVCCTSLPAALKTLVYALCLSLSACITSVFDARVTHLVTGSSQSDKYAAACRYPSCHPVLPSYPLSCFLSASLLPVTAEFSHRLLTSLRICVTMIDAPERENYKRLIRAEGGKYAPDLTRECTHLIAPRAEGRKYEAATLWQQHIVSIAWLTDSVKERRRMPETDYRVGPAAAEDEAKGRTQQLHDADEDSGQHEADGHGGGAQQQQEEPKETRRSEMRANGGAGGGDDAEDDDDQEAEAEQQRKARVRGQQLHEDQQREREEKRTPEEEEQADEQPAKGGRHRAETVRRQQATSVASTGDSGSGTGWRQKARRPVRGQQQQREVERGADERAAPTPSPPSEGAPTRNAPPSVSSPPPAQPPASTPVPDPPTIPIGMAEPFSPSLSSSSTTSSSSSSSFPSPSVYDAANDSFLDTAQILVSFPAGSPQLLRAVMLTRAGGATRFSCYRPSVTHIVTSSLSFLASSLRSDRYSLLPASLLASSSPFALCSSLPCPVVSIDWLERCVASHQLLPPNGFELQEEPPAVAAASSRLSSVARQGVAEDFAAFNASISKSRLGRGAAGKEAKKERRRTRSAAGGSGIFASRLFLLAGLDFDVEQELLLSIRRAGGDVIAEDEEETVDLIVTPAWDATLAARHPRAEVVSPAFIHDCIAASLLLSPAASITFSPLPDPVVAIPAFSAFTMSCTGFQAAEKQLLSLLIPALGSAVTDGLNGANTHLIVKDDCAEGKKWERVWAKVKGGRSWRDRGKPVRYAWLLRCAREGRYVDEEAWLLKKEDGEQEKAKAREKPEDEQRTSRQQTEAAGRAATPQTQAATAVVVPMQDEERTQQQQMMEDDDAPAAAEQRTVTAEAMPVFAAHSAEVEEKQHAGLRKRAGRLRTRASEEANEEEEEAEESKHERSAKAVVRKRGGAKASGAQQLNGGLAEPAEAESTRTRGRRAAAAPEREEEKTGAEEVKEQPAQSVAVRVEERKAERVREEVKEQHDDDLLLLQAAASSPVDPFSLPRYGRQHGTVARANRIFTPPKTPSAGNRSSAAAESGKAEQQQQQQVRRKLPMLEEGNDDPFGFRDERADDEEKNAARTGQAQDGKAEKKEAETKERGAGKATEKQGKEKDAARGRGATAAPEQNTPAETDDAHARQQLTTMPAAEGQRQRASAKAKQAGAVTAKPQVRRAVPRQSESKADAEREVEDAAEAEEAEQKAELKQQHQEEQASTAKAEAKATRGDKRATPASERKMVKRAGKGDDTEAVEEKEQAAQGLAEELKQEEPVSNGSGRKPAKTAKVPNAATKTAAAKRERKSAAETGSERVEAPAAQAEPAAAAAGSARQPQSARAQRKQALKEREKEREEETPLKPKQRPAAKRKAAAAADSEDADDTGEDVSGRSAGKKFKRDTDSSSASSASSSSSSMHNLFCFALSGFKPGERGVDKYSAMIRSLHGAVLPDVCVDYSLCSALITHGEQPLKRTEKTLVAVVAGLPIVNRRYVEDSAQQHHWLSIGRYRLKSAAPGVEAGSSSNSGSMGDALLRAGERWRVRRPCRDWTVHLHLTDGNVERMLRNVLSMGGAVEVKAEDAGITHAFVGDVEGERKAELLPLLRSLWSRAVPVFRSDYVADFVCFSHRKGWDDALFLLTKDNWNKKWSNPWREELSGGSSSQSTAGDAAADKDRDRDKEADSKTKKRKRS